MEKGKQGDRHNSTGMRGTGIPNQRIQNINNSNENNIGRIIDRSKIKFIDREGDSNVPQKTQIRGPANLGRQRT